MKDESEELRLQIAQRLRQAREASGLTQGQVAKRLNLHRPTISEIEAGRRRVSGDEISLLADLYGVDAGWIVEGSDASNEGTDKIMFAARQLSHLKDKDLDRLLQLVQMLRGKRGANERK
jgi:transcriptional regulator with XRE-family HTH domain